MRANLIGGKLVEPASPQAAMDRHRQVSLEVARIEREIALPKPVDRTTGDHARWLTRAKGALGWLRDEQEQLAEWIALATPKGMITSEFWLRVQVSHEVSVTRDEIADVLVRAADSGMINLACERELVSHDNTRLFEVEAIRVEEKK